jgi:esterase/lipase
MTKLFLRNRCLLVVVSLVILAGVTKSVPGAETPGRTLQYSRRSGSETQAWQRDLRSGLFQVLKLDDLAARDEPAPLDASEISSQEEDGYCTREVEITSMTGRRIRCLVTRPQAHSGPFPAVVCIHGHGGNRHTVYSEASRYKRFAATLAQSGYVTISTDVGQHELQNADRTLMGERLWDLIRCVDYLESMPEVNRLKIGCAGLSLGGEMAMWLGAMDERVSATVSCGFLTRMDQMETNHCMCWKFPGLRDLVDFADIYSLTAPRALQCQNGQQEPASQFPPSLAKEAMAEIQMIYEDLGKKNNVALVVHEGGHEVDVPSLQAFLVHHLGRPELTQGD